MPGADLRLTTMIEMPDFTADEVDVTIQWGFGGWKDFESTLLVRDPKIICCAPALAGRIRAPVDLMQQTLLHPVLASNLWGRVARHLGLESPNMAGALQFQDAATMRRATVSGIGVGLVSRIDAIEDLQTGRLVAPLGEDALLGMGESDIPGFYLILPRAHRRVQIIQAFCDWITSENWDQLLYPK